jgi:hypothetical protein
VYVNRPQLRSSDDPADVISPGSIDHIAPDGTRTTVLGGLHHPSGVAIGPGGSLYTVDVQYGPLRANLLRRSFDGAVTDLGPVLQTDAGSAVSVGGWAFEPVVAPGGDVLINRPEVLAAGEPRRVLSRGGIDRFMASGRRRVVVNRAGHPSGLSFDAAGNLFFRDVANGPLRAELFRLRGGRGRPMPLRVVADTTGGFVSTAGWGFDTAVESRVDLSVRQVAVSSSRRARPAPPGARGVARVSIANAGPSAIARVAEVNLYLSSDPVLDGADTLAGSATSLLRLRPGRSRAVRLRFNSPTLGGNYFVLARVTVLGVVDGVVEADASNNVAAAAAPLAVSPQPGD